MHRIEGTVCNTIVQLSHTMNHLEGFTSVVTTILYFCSVL